MNKPLLLPPPNQGRQWLASLLGKHPEASFLGSADDDLAWAWVPSGVRQGFIKQAFLLAKSLELQTSSELSTLRATVALGWELTCLRRALKDGEVVAGSAQRIKTRITGYPRYAKGQRLSDPPGPSEERLQIQNDVAIVREKEGRPLPYLVECKSSNTHPYGQDYGINPKAPRRLGLGSVNQLLRYQAAMDHGLIAGATLEISGRIHPLMVEWMLEGVDGEGTRIPDVEILWHAPLPSGATGVFLLKAGKGPGRWMPREANHLEDRQVWEAFHSQLPNLSALQELCWGQPQTSTIEDPGVAARLTAVVRSAAGHSAPVIEQPWETQDIPTWRAFVEESRRQTVKRLLDLPAASPPPLAMRGMNPR